jgi:chromosome partitioning protein
VIALANQKGGTGKTTTTVNLGIGLARLGKKVLLIDADPQGDLTTCLGWQDQDSLQTTLATVMGKIIRDEPFTTDEGILHHSEGVDLMPANIELSALEMSLVNAMSREFTLRTYVNEAKKHYDVVLIDCMPSLGMITINALAAADTVLVPMQCEYYALEGLTDLVNTLKRIKQSLNRRIEIEGLLRTMFDPRSTLSQQVSAQLEAHFGDKVFKAIIPRNVRLAEAPSHGMPGVVFDKAAKGSQAYLTFAAEMIERIKTI